MNLFDSNRVYLIAEIGGNHEGSFGLAQKQLELAIESGADCIKFQLYRGDTLVNSIVSPDRNSHFKRFELTKEQHMALATRCIEAGRDYLASVWDLEMLEWIDPYLNRYKIGSGDLTALPILKAFASRGKPVILSTGLATQAEVQTAVDVIRNTNAIYREPGMLAVLQCTSMYPIPDSDANLSVIRSLAEIPGITVGYSDHTVGLEAMVTSVAVGARILEFHFTDKREGRDFRDHKVSLMAQEVKELRIRIEQVMTLLGTPDKRPLEIEIANGHLQSFRRGVYPARDLEAGTVISANDLICLRPAEGIEASQFDELVGRRLEISVKRLQTLDWCMIG